MTETNSSLLIHDSIKALENNPSMLFNRIFANNTILLCFFFFFLIIDFLIPTVIVQIFNPITELVIFIGIPSKETKEETEIYPVTAENKIRKCSI